MNGRAFVGMIFCATGFVGIIFLDDLHHLTQNAIPKLPLHDIGLGEEPNAAAIDPISNPPVEGQSHPLLHLALPGNVPAQGSAPCKCGQ